MFSLQIHSVDFPQRLDTTVITASAIAKHGNSTAADNDSVQVEPVELRGVVHLFRHLPPPATTIANPYARSTLCFVVAVPNYLTADDFLLFAAAHLPYSSEIVFLRNDAMEDRYSVLIRLLDQLSADSFYCRLNGKRFKPSEAEVCHIYFIQSVEYNESAENASSPPIGYTELPTCPVCLERLDHDTSGIQSTLCDHSFHCACISKWTYLSCQVCRLCHQQDEKPTCTVCGTLKNLWVCLICGFVGCGRYMERHAIQHWSDTKHHYSLELETQQIWDYVGDKYVHRLNQSKADGKLVVNAIDGECGTCRRNEDSELDGALVTSKFETVVDEYNHLLASQLDIQRQHFESLLAEARSRKESSVSKAVEKAVFSKMHDMQDTVEQYVQQTKAVADTNQELMKKQELLQKKFKEIEERESSLLKSKDEKILDLEEQIRDLKIFVEARRKLADMSDSDGIKGGTLLPVESSHPTPSNSRRRTKLGRKRN